MILLKREPSPQLEALRSELGSVLAARCAPCHRGDADDAKPMALDVFDVSAERWWTWVSTRQLGALQQRLMDEPSATEPERAWSPSTSRPSSRTAGERDWIKRKPRRDLHWGHAAVCLIP